MPSVQNGESQDSYMGRCMPMMLKEGKEKDQASAICMSMYREHKAKESEHMMPESEMKKMMDDMKKKGMSEEEMKKKKASMMKKKKMMMDGQGESIEWLPESLNLNVTEAEGQPKSLKISGIALTTGKSRNGRRYTFKNIEENNGEMFNFLVGHRKEDYDSPDHNVGEGVYIQEGDKLRFEGEISNCISHPDIVEKVSKGLVSVSIQGSYDPRSTKVENGEVIVEGLRIPILALVNKHVRGVPAATIESMIAERIENEVEQKTLHEGEKMSEELSKQIQEKDEQIKALQMKIEAKEMEGKLKVIESLVSMNKDFKKEDLMEMSMKELELMEKYEKKMKESKPESRGKSEVSEKSPQDVDGVVIERNGDITMSEAKRREFNDELMHSIYR